MGNHFPLGLFKICHHLKFLVHSAPKSFSGPPHGAWSELSWSQGKQWPPGSAGVWFGHRRCPRTGSSRADSLTQGTGETASGDCPHTPASQPLSGWCIVHLCTVLCHREPGAGAGELLPAVAWSEVTSSCRPD